MVALSVAAARPVAARAVVPPRPGRKMMIAKIQIAKKQLGFDDGDYRAVLERITGKTSTTVMTEAELGLVLDEFARLGWKPAPGKGKSSRRADHPAAKKARALWISLGLLGAIRNSSEAALESFAKRQLKGVRLQWADQQHVYKLIEALKSMAERHDWSQSTVGLLDAVWTLKLRLCEAIARRLVAEGAVPPTFRIADELAARFGITGRVRELGERHLEQLASSLGARLAQHLATRADIEFGDGVD